jgi:AcrR family transcriptional regulator
MNEAHLSRAERRTHTEQRILAVARALFADRGFERTTIRAVAAVASVDPALVMQYFGSKQELFSRAIQVAPADTAAAGPAEFTELLLASLGMTIGELPGTSLAMMRSMLTHPEAADAARATLDQHIEQLSSAIPAEDSRLRAALAVTAVLGVTIGHQLLDVAALRGTSPEQLAGLLRPCLRGLISCGQ